MRKMKKCRWIAVLSVLALTLALLPTAALAADDTSGRFEQADGVTYFYQDVTASLPHAQSGFTYELKYALRPDGTAALVKANSVNSTHYAEATLGVLGTITHDNIDYTVTTIGSEAFKYSQVRVVNLPSTLTTIEPKAFIYCYDAEQIDIPAGVTSIGESAFWSCQSIERIAIPSGVTEIPDGAFSSCWAATGLTIPANVTTIGEKAFQGLGKQAATPFPLTIPKNVTSIGYEAFRECGADSVTVEAGRTQTLQLNGAFRVCNKLLAVDLRSGKVVIGNNEFQNCPKLGTLTLASGIQSLGDWAFDGASSLEEVVLPSTVASLGSGAFYECANAVIYYPTAATLANSYTLGGVKTKVSYSIDEQEGAVSVDAVTGDAMDKIPGVIAGLRVCAVPEAYRPAGKHEHYYGAADFLAYCAICQQPNPAHAHRWEAPVWTWAQDGGSAEAAFVCTEGAGHTQTLAAVVTSQKTPATCTQNGRSDNTASVEFEGRTYTDAKSFPIQAAGHQARKIDAKAPTATEAGNIAYWVCPACGGYFQDEALTQPITLEQTMLPPTGAAEPAPTPGVTPAPGTSGAPQITATPEITPESEAPRTGDPFNPLPWALLLASGLALAVLALRRTRNAAKR